MASADVDRELETLIRARYPIIYIVSWEEKRVEDALRAIAQARGKKIFFWTITQGMVLNPNHRDNATRDPLAALDFVMDSRDQALFVLKDYHAFITDVTVTRRLRDLTVALKTSYKTLLILSPILKLPTELEKEVTVVDYGLPDIEDLDRILESIIQAVKDNPQVNTQLTEFERDQILKAAQGLTASEAENVLAKSLVEKQRFDVDVILSEKEQIIRKSGILEYYPFNEQIGDVGGLDLLKDWMEKRTVAFTEKARDFGLPAPRGVLLLGVQGCGKSLSAKAIGALWRLPLLRLDVGRIFGGIVGQSEENMRKAIRVAESVSPAILWIDELEKGFSGTQSSAQSDGGTTSRVFGTFLSWMQDKKAATFVVATSNDVKSLPPELLRKGRFDEIFFIDLPSEAERREIFRIHLKKRRRNPDDFDLDALAAATPGFSGAEIEAAVVEALYDAFDETRDLTTEDILKAARNTFPLSMTMRERIEELREWAATRARPASSEKSEDMLTIAEELMLAKLGHTRTGARPVEASGDGQERPAAEPPADPVERVPVLPATELPGSGT
ncbi:MAG: AAA family ATPase [Chloroherpetonaceae bacterium]|nr:AAA family ATPase [Chthonomonadaceae bacterium]MDW8206928.1 AAA family ATPase [Chloroherpetonaceae bacterium]